MKTSDCGFAFIFFIITCLIVPSEALGQVFKCVGNGGNTVYQSDPCPPQMNLTIKQWMQSKGNPISYSGTRLTISFHDAPVGKFYQVLSSVLGTELDVGSEAGEILRKTKGDFFSNNTPWDSLLREVDTRYGLQTMFVKGHMYVLTQHDIVIAETPKTPPVRTQDDAIYDAVEAKFEKQYPELNPQSSNFNEVLVNKIKKRILEFRRRNPDATASEALSFAVLNTMSK